MATLSDDEMSDKIQTSLRDTPYACTTLQKLSGGTANFVYRGTLSTPLADNTKTVVIKHTEPYVASHPSFKLSVNRCEFEETILSSLSTLPASKHANITISTPHLLHFSPTTNTQIHSDLPSSTELKTYILTHHPNRPQCHRLGTALGIWTRKFHGWAQAPAQAALKQSMKGNRDMRELKYRINYERLLETVDSFPGVLRGSKAVFEGVRDAVRRRLDGEGGVLIHGDFWSGNVLLPNAPLPEEDEKLEMFIIDWELSHLSSIAFDIGQMLAELYELKLFKDIDAGTWLMESFMLGYGKIDDELAFDIAIHMGVHLIVWGSRVEGWGTKEQIERVVEVGRNWVVAGWARDKKALDFVFH